MKRLLCATLEGLEAQTVEVEVALGKGLPSFQIVGLGGAAIQESKERIKAALSAVGYTFPPLRITVNLSPSDLQKSGSHFDLPIALAIALHDTPVSLAEGTFVFGELGLDGTVKSTRTLFPLILSLRDGGVLQKAIVPTEALNRLGMIPGVELIGVGHLSEATALLKGEFSGSTPPSTAIEGETLRVGGKTFYYLRDYPEDFAQVKGQKLALRAALIAAAGMHNLLMEGSPGCGKSMIAKRIRHIMPPLSLEEILQNARYSLLGGEEPDFKPKRPFKSPHHTASRASIFGGGSRKAQIGEAALANGGILFFDELPHFPKSVLEALREPLQDHRIRIARVESKITYETRFLFIAAQNPCPCGNLLSRLHTCRCTELEIKRYKNRLSDPLLERIDLYVAMQESDPADRPSTDSTTMHRQVINAFVRQMERGQTVLNGKLDEAQTERFCRPSLEGAQALELAVRNLGLSHRAVGNVLRVARTVADLEGSDRIEKRHILEALGFRRR